jgi:hypothetical protein
MDLAGLLVHQQEICKSSSNVHTQSVCHMAYLLVFIPPDRQAELLLSQ